MALVTDSLTIPPAGSLNATGQSAAKRQLPAAAERAVVPVVYGEDRISGLLLNVLAAAGAPGTLLVQVLWCHACTSVEDLRLNDAALPASAAVTHYTGSQTTPDASLVAAFSAQGIGGVGALTGYAWSLIAMPAAAFDGQLNFTARIRGRKVYDPEFDSTAGGSGSQRLADPSTWDWRDVPALCLADFLASTVYGAGQAVDWASVRTTAAANRAIVPGTVAERRRVVGVSFTMPASTADVAETLRAYAGCFLLPSASGIRLLPDANDAPVAAYRHADGQIAAIEPLELRDMGQAPTAVEVIYTDTTAIPWRDASEVVTLTGAGTTRPWRLSQVRMPGIHRAGQARREATERLNKLVLNDITTTLEVFDEGIRHELGDIVTVTHPLGLAETAMRISGPPTMPAPGRWRLPLVRHNAAAYSNAVATAAVIADASRIVGTPAPVMWEDVEGRPADGDILNANVAIPRGAMNADPGLLAPSTAWTWDAGINVQGPSTVPGALGVRFFSGEPGALNARAWSLQTFPLSAARTYNLSALLYAFFGNDRNMYLVVDMYRADGSQLDGTHTGWGGAFAGYTYGGQPTPGQFSRYGADFGAGTARPIPVEAAYCRIGVWFQYSTGSSSVQHAAEDIRLVDVTEAYAAGAAASAAQGTANTASTNASNALTTLATMRSNGYIDAAEKPALIRTWQAIYDEQSGIYAAGSTYGLTVLRDAYYSAYAALATYLGGLSPSWSDTSTDTPITPATDQATWAAYYSARQALLNAIPPAAQAAAVTAAAADATAKAATAQAAAQAYAEAQAAAAEIAAKAHADGVVSVEEARAIADAEAKANAARDAAIAAAAADATAKATSARLTAEAYALAQAAAADTSARAYADGIVTAEEARAIADADAKATAARIAAEAAAAADATAKANAAALTAQWSGVDGRPFDYDQDAAPSGTITEGSTWRVPSTGKTYRRLGGAWQPYVGGGSVGTGELAPNAATKLSEVLISSTEITGSSIITARDSYSASYNQVASITFTPDVSGLATVFVTGTVEVSEVYTRTASELAQCFIHLAADLNSDGTHTVDETLVSLMISQYIPAGSKLDWSGQVSGRMQFSVTGGVARTVRLYGQQLHIAPATRVLRDARLAIEEIKR